VAGSKKRRAVVIGGSMSGLLSGLLLRRAGWDVDIYERVDSELSGRGAGIVAQAELIERLRGLGLKTDALGVQIATRKIFDAQGRVVRVLTQGQLTAGRHEAFWDGRDDDGRGMASGVYLAEVTVAGVGSDRTKLILVR